MKTIPLHLLLVLSCLALGSAVAGAVPVANLIGQPDVAVTTTSQDLEHETFSGKTNVVRGVTNEIVVVKSTTTNSTLNAAALLTLLANSFNTNFPAGTQLLLVGSQGFYSFAVSDATGTNISSLPVNTVLNSIGWSRIHSGKDMRFLTNGVASLGNDTESFTEAISFQYDDTALSGTGDGTTTTFSWNCLVEVKGSRNDMTGIATENVTMTLTGAGQVRNQPGNVFTGTIRAKLSGKAPNA